MRLGQHVLQEPQLVQEMGCARLQHLSAKLALEIFVSFEHQDLGAPLGQEQTEHEPGWPSAHDARAHADARHGPSAPSAEAAGEGPDPLDTATAAQLPPASLRPRSV